MQPDQQPIPQSPSPIPGVVTEPHKSNAVQIVWQWLCYSLWGWALITLSILLSATLTYYLVDKTGDYEFMVYTLAAMICLLPLAFLADRVYAKQEPEQKHGFASVILVVHAVIVFLAALGGLITSVVTVFSIFISPGDTSTKQVVIISSLVVTVLGGMLFGRIMNPPQLHRFARLFRWIVLVIAGLAVLLAVFGPFGAQVQARDDKLIEENLPRINDAIQEYAREKNQLPASLQELDLDTAAAKDARALRDRNLVEYRVISQESRVEETPDRLGSPILEKSSLAQRVGRYELCVTFKRTKNDDGSSRYRLDEYETYLTVYSHKAGRECYKLQAYLD